VTPEAKAARREMRRLICFSWLIVLVIIEDSLRFRFSELKLGADLLNLRRLLFHLCLLSSGAWSFGRFSYFCRDQN
jgi:hypothetical protein